jgi:protein-L-isoaspartate(D-aspartate) O-methyltransferase
MQRNEIIVVISVVILLILLVVVWQPWKVTKPVRHTPSSQPHKIKVIKKIIPQPEDIPAQPEKKPKPQGKIVNQDKKTEQKVPPKKTHPEKLPPKDTQEVKPKKSYPRQDERDFMVDTQLIPRGINDKKVIKAFRDVPRHLFVPDRYKAFAYDDNPLPIGYGQTISQPYIVALMTQLLELDGSEKVLEIGTGSGYQAAILAEIVKEVYTIEIIPELAKRASRTLEKCGYKNIQTGVGDGYFGWKEHQPFDAIIVTAAASHVPPPLLKQLKDGGILVIPIGNPMLTQTLTIYRKRGEEIEINYSIGCRFVPMTGQIQKVRR